MLDQINWEMLIAFTVLLTFHGSIFLKLAKNTFITKKEHNKLSEKLNARLYQGDGMPIFVPQKGCDRRQAERDRRQTEHVDRTCLAIKELKKEVKELRELILGKLAIATK